MTKISKKLDLPKFSEKKSAWIMKILSGVHIGGEMQLDWQLYKLGASQKNDIVLRDRDIAEHHLDIEIVAEGEDGRVYITPGQGGVEVNGQVIKGRTEVKNFDLISTGSTFFVIGHSNAKWPQMMVLSLMSKSGESSTEKRGTVSMERQDNVEPGPTKVTKPDTGGKTLLWLFSMFTLVIAGIAAYLLIEWYYREEQKKLDLIQEETRYNQALKLIHDWVKNNPNMEVHVVSDRHSKIITVTGYVPEQSNLLRLKELVPSALGVKVLPHLFVVEDLLAQAESIINSFNFDLEVYYGGQGSIIISGVLLHKKHFSDLENKLYEYVNGLKSIYDKAVMIDDLDLEIGAVVILPHKRYIVTADGKMIQEGTFVSANIKLKYILHEHLVLEKNEMEIIFDFRKNIVRRAPVRMQIKPEISIKEMPEQNLEHLSQ